MLQLFSDLNARHLETNVVRIILRLCQLHATQLQQRIQAYDNDIFTSWYKIHLKFFITAEIVQIDAISMMLFENEVCDEFDWAWRANLASSSLFNLISFDIKKFFLKKFSNLFYIEWKNNYYSTLIKNFCFNIIVRKLFKYWIAI